MGEPEAVRDRGEHADATEHARRESNVLDRERLRFLIVSERAK
jgi:hypothetical protein